MHSDTTQSNQTLATDEHALRFHVADVVFNAAWRGANTEMSSTELVLLHGLGGSLHTWDKLLPLLPPQLTTLRYDLRDFGHSVATSSAPFSHSDDLLALLDAAGINRCHLLGVSMGGGVALNFAFDHPDRVKSLLLVSPALVAWEWSTQWRNLWRPIVNAARADDMATARQLWWQHPLFASTRKTVAATQLHDSIMAFSGAQWLHDNQRASLPDIERLHHLCVPTLLLSGEQDMDDFRLIADVISASAAHVQRVDLSGGHMLHMEQPQACAEIIASFLAA